VKVDEQSQDPTWQTVKMERKNKQGKGKKQQNTGRRVEAPLSTATIGKVRSPRFAAGGPRSVVVSHREYVTDVITTSNTGLDTVFSTSINPGIPTAFPWLSTIANSYELYTFRRLEFQYIQRSNATVTGSVILSYDLDALDPVATDKVELFNQEGTVVGSVWSNSTLRVPTDALTRFARERYTRKGIYDVTDAKTYDVCRFDVTLDFFPSTTVCVGEIWVDYEVVLYQPQIRYEEESGELDNDASAGILATRPFGASDSTEPVLSDTFSKLFLKYSDTQLQARTGICGIIDMVSSVSDASVFEYVVSLTKATTQSNTKVLEYLGSWSYVINDVINSIRRIGVNISKGDILTFAGSGTTGALLVSLGMVFLPMIQENWLSIPTPSVVTDVVDDLPKAAAAAAVKHARYRRVDSKQ
jgi:hypothetical protein